jgi:hypothetical protein
MQAIVILSTIVITIIITIITAVLSITIIVTIIHHMYKTLTRRVWIPHIQTHTKVIR